MMNVLGLYPCQNRGLMKMLGINTDRIYVREDIVVPNIMQGVDGINRFVGIPNDPDIFFAVDDNDGNRIMTVTQNAVSFFENEFVIARRNNNHQ